jgi:hypothetical protein
MTFSGTKRKMLPMMAWTSLGFVYWTWGHIMRSVPDALPMSDDDDRPCLMDLFVDVLMVLLLRLLSFSGGEYREGRGGDGNDTSAEANACVRSRACV